MLFRSAVLHCGFGPHEVFVVDIKSSKTTCRVALSEAFVGVAFTPDGKRLVASGAGKEVVHAFDFSDGLLGNARAFALRPAKERGVASGIVLSPDASRLYVANVLGQSVSELSLAAGLASASVAREFILGEPVAAPTDADADPDKGLDEESITKRARALLENLGGDSPYPYACVLDAARQRLYVSLWGQSSIAVIDLASGQSAQRWKVQEIGRAHV